MNVANRQPILKHWCTPHGRVTAWLVAAVLGAAAVCAPAAPPTGADLHIASTPTGAACTLDGSPKGITPISLTGLQPGAHLLVLSKDGFEPLRRTVQLLPAARESLELPLVPLTGLALIHTSPDGAAIQINGADRGPAPLLVTDLPIGRHRIRISSPDYLPKEVDLDLPSRAPVKVNVVLLPRTATITITSEPPGASVTLDGTPRGESPVELQKVQPGDHRVSLLLPGYAVAEHPFRTESGQVDTINVPLTPVPARLRVVSTPSAARVYLDNQLRGETPLTLESLPPGSYRLRVEADGYATESRTLALDLAANITEEVRLENNAGALQLTTEPAGVVVNIDGREVGATTFDTNATDQVSLPLTVRPLLLGAHTLQLAKPGYFDQSVPIDVRIGETLTLHRALVRRFIPDFEVETRTGRERGVLRDTDPEGTIRLEVRPGVIKTIRAGDVLRARPIQQRDLPDIRPAAAPDAAPSPAPALRP